jgi:hypothetical protein
MINFFFKKKEIVLDCFTFDSSVYNYAKIQPAVFYAPLWFKKVPKSYREPNRFVGYIDASTVKGCYGITEYFQQSFIMPWWGDLVVKSSPNEFGFWFAHDVYNNVSQHDPKQTNCTFIEHYEHLKFHPPWVFKCTKDINFLLVEPFWNNSVSPTIRNNFIVQHGVINFKNGMTPNINVFIPKDNFRIQLNHNEPLVQFFPLTDKKIKVVNHLVSQEEFNNKMIMPPKVFLKRMWKGKRIEKND